MEQRRAGQTILRTVSVVIAVAMGLQILSTTTWGDETTGNTATKENDKAEKWNLLTKKWRPIEFGGEGEVKFEKNLIRLAMGSPLTGVCWKGDVQRENYEIELEARRVEGLDFFCALTFPVGKDHVSFVLGGWGGGVVGISSVDGYDASENDTTMYQQFKMNQWYKVRTRVSDAAIQCWIDDQIAVDQPRQGHTFDIRFEMDASTPVGIAAFQCKSEIRNVRMRELTAAEINLAAADQRGDEREPQPAGGDE